MDARNAGITYHTNHAAPWRVTLVDTGADTMTGGRLKRVSRYLDPDESFCMTYGDGVADIDIDALIAFHQRHGGLATVTAVTPPGRYGALLLQDDRVVRFSEKPPGDNALINGGFFVLHPDVLERIAGDDMPWGDRAARKPGARRRVVRLPPHRLLAAHGHAARQDDARGVVVVGRRAMEDVEGLIIASM